MNDRAIKPTIVPAEERERLRAQLEQARRDLLEAEAELAEEQAAVNAFRMHCRLKLDEWVNTLLALQTEKQSLLTRLELLKQAHEEGLPFGEADDFWQGDAGEGEQPREEAELILPTDTPRDKAAEKRLYRQLARKFHPDLGQTAVEVAYRTEMMTAVNAAYSGADIQALYDLAGELDPQEVAELATIETLESRRMRERLLHLRRRRRRAVSRLSALRNENTARLWQKARRLESDDTHWWEVVRREIERAIGQIRDDVTHLQALIASLEIPPEEQAAA